MMPLLKRTNATEGMMPRQTIHVRYKEFLCECSYPVQKRASEVEEFTFDRAYTDAKTVPATDFTATEQEYICWKAYDKYTDPDQWGDPNEPHLIDRDV